MDRVLYQWGVIAGVQGAVSISILDAVVFIKLLAYDIEDAGF